MPIESGNIDTGGGGRGLSAKALILGAGIVVGLVAGAGLGALGGATGRFALLAPLAVSLVAGGAAWGLSGTPGAPAGLFPSDHTLKLGTARITQGLEYDVSAGVAYDLIADKNTLVRVPIITDGIVTKATCKVQKAFETKTISALGSSVDVLLPVTEEPRRVRAEVSSVTAAPSTDGKLLLLVDAPTYLANCWLDGLQVPDSAYYRFDLEVEFSGGKRKSAAIGLRQFLPTGDLRILVYEMTWPKDKDITNSELHPWTFGCKDPCPKTDPRLIYRAWDDAATAAVLETMAEFQRVLPLRRGVGGIDFAGNGPHSVETPGFRFVIAPGVYECPASSLLIAGHSPDGSCDARARDSAEFWINLLNAKLKKNDAVDGRRRDRLDWGIVVTLNGPGSTGGQSCWGDTGPHVAGAEIDTFAASAGGAVVIQELTHCIGLVSKTSPNSQSGNAIHSKNGLIPLFKGFQLVNMRTRTDIPKSYSALNAGVGSSSTNFMEGYEWNQLRQTLLDSTRRLDPVTSTFKLVSTKTAGPLFVLLGSIDPAGVMAVDYSAMVPDLELEPTVANPSGDYALVFIDAAGREAGSLRFNLPAAGTHQVEGHEFTRGVSLVAALPPSAAAYEIRKSGNVLASGRFSGRAPAIGSATFTPTDELHGRLSWQALDADGDRLTFNVSLDLGDGSAPMVLATGSTDNFYDFSAQLAPASQAARLTVDASDGFNVSSASSQPFRIPPRAPLVVISSPRTADASPVAGEPLSFEAIGYDYTAGTLGADAFEWRSDRDGVLGKGASLRAALSEGDHIITVKTNAPSGLSGSAELRLKVQPATSSRPPAIFEGIASIDLGRCETTRSASFKPSLQVQKIGRDSSWLGGHFGDDGKITVEAQCADLPDGLYTGRLLLSGRPGEFGAVEVRLTRGGGTTVSAWDVAIRVCLGLAAAGVAFASVKAVRFRRRHPGQ